MGDRNTEIKVISIQTFKRFRRCLQANDCPKTQE